FAFLRDADPTPPHGGTSGPPALAAPESSLAHVHTAGRRRRLDGGRMFGCLVRGLGGWRSRRGPRRGDRPHARPPAREPRAAGAAQEGRAARRTRGFTRGA